MGGSGLRYFHLITAGFLFITDILEAIYYSCIFFIFTRTFQHFSAAVRPHHDSTRVKTETLGIIDDRL